MEKNEEKLGRVFCFFYLFFFFDQKVQIGGVIVTIMARFHLMVVAHAKVKFSFLSRYFLGEENTECRSSVVGVCSASSSHCWRVISQ